MSSGCDWSFDLLDMAHARDGHESVGGLLGGTRLACLFPCRHRRRRATRWSVSSLRAGVRRWSGTQIATEGVRGGRRTVTRLPSGKAADPLRARRTKREATAGTTAHPKRNNKATPSATPGDTSEPVPPQRAAFWAHGPGSGVCDRCPPRVLLAALCGTPASAIARGALATRTSATAPTATAMPRPGLIGPSLTARRAD
jgi:hypothetical protein